MGQTKKIFKLKKNFFPKYTPPLSSDTQYTKSIADSQKTLGLLSHRDPAQIPRY